MSFITKRERVFNEYDLFDLPARNEGKLKAYASCTDARAWSHFCSDKTEHLVEIIKRNNETCRPKYVPTDVIVDTIMVAKNAEISRLRRKIEEFEQMLAAYDQLDLDSDQKCEIAKAHASIKAANKELEELCLDLDMSGYTEGIDSEAFETGKSRGDELTKTKSDETPKSSRKANEISFELEPIFSKMESIGVQKDTSCVCDVSITVCDPRIEEMEEVIIAKDAKLGAMKNTIAVMEIDLCEPYCLYAHIYTALEKIFATLCQNEKYKHYLGLLTAGKDTRCIDIRGKILFKIKVIEKFCEALIAPCSQDFTNGSSPRDCACYRAEVSSRVETVFALTSAETKLVKPNLDNKRAQLVADIIENEEMKEILSKESSLIKPQDDEIEYGSMVNDYSIDMENLTRLKNLQENYDDLMICYETLKYEKECLEGRYQNYVEMEKEFENLKNQMREYNSLWNEKEHYRKRSADLDVLKEQYLILRDETLNIETQLKAETEINHIKSKSIDELRNENILLQEKLNDISITFEKDKNVLLCKLKKADCRMMCQEQQIKSLSLQINKLLEQNHEKGLPHDVETHSIVLIDEVESLKQQIKNLKDAIFCNEEEKQQLHSDFQDKLQLINQLRMEIEDWKSTYDKTLHRNDYLEKYTESFREEVHRLIDENRLLSQDLEEKNTAVENLINVFNNKSQEVKKLKEEVDRKTDENNDLSKRFHELQELYNREIGSLENENKQALKSLQIARQESQELLEKINDYDDLIHKKQNVSKSLESQIEDNMELRNLLSHKIEENKTLRNDIVSRKNSNSILLQEIQRLREINTYAVENISTIQDERNQYKLSLELTKKESGILKDRLEQFENFTQQLQNLRASHERLIEEKKTLENELLVKSCELDNAIHRIQLTKKESAELIEKLQESENLSLEIHKLREDFQHLNKEKHVLHNELLEKNKDMENFVQSLNSVKAKNEELLQKCRQTNDFQQQLKDLQKAYDDLVHEKNTLQNDFDNKTEEINKLYNTLEFKIEENRQLLNEKKHLQENQLAAENNMKLLKNEKVITEATLNIIKGESAELIDKLKHCETLESDFNALKKAHDQVKTEKQTLQAKLDAQLTELKKLELQNHELQSHSQNLLTHSEDLENALVNTRTELFKQSGFSNEPYKDIIKEIEEMKKEKLLNHQKIKELLDRLEESESIISDLSEDVLARDDRIAILQNHINELEDEVRILQSNLDKVVDAGEHIKDYSYQKIDKSLKNMEAHHSRATHNMKMELAKLQHENNRLEEQLSKSRIKSEESSHDIHKYMSQIIHLRNEREIIVTDIKQLELESVGDSALSPERCNVEDILTSLERVRKCLDATHSKSTSLEQTLLKVQTSSQLLLSKADEAKKLVEKEKQKIINEKEEAIRDRTSMEKNLLDLKEKLTQQSANDKMIKDLESEILNQELIIDNIKKSTQDYISKLKDEMQSLQDLYQNSISKISELQEKIETITGEKNKYVEVLKKTNIDLEQKSKEIEHLQKNLEELQKKKPNLNVTTQTQVVYMFLNMETQTDLELLYGDENIEYEITQLSAIKRSENSNNITSEINNPSLNKKYFESESKVNNVNEVQVLTANIDPTFAYVKSSYLNYKIKRLGPCKLEHYSISCPSDNESNADSCDLSGLSTNILNQTPNTSINCKDYTVALAQNPRVIDIYNKKSMHTNSSKDNGELETTTRGLAQGNKFVENSKYNIIKYFDESTSSKSTDKDLFLIFKDSESDNTDKKFNYNKSWQRSSQEIVESFIVDSTYNEKVPYQNIKYINPKKILHKEPSIYFEEEGDDSVKPKLEINLPRVENETSLVNTSDGEKKSLDSYTVGSYATPKRLSSLDIKIGDDVYSTKFRQDSPSLPTVSYEDNIYREILSPNVSSENEAIKYANLKKLAKVIAPVNRNFHSPIKQQNTKKLNTTIELKQQVHHSDSHHILSRVEADVLLLKTGQDIKLEKNADNNQSTNFGLEYIMDTVKCENDPKILKYYPSNEFRKTRSEERFKSTRVRDKNNKSESSTSRLSTLKISSHDYKTISTVSKYSDKSRPKYLMDQNVMVKMDINQEYENKIKHLTKTLENLEKDYKKKIKAIKIQYDRNIKSIINEHNQGVQSIQGLHEETLQDIIKLHENEVENLRTMSIDAMRKADKLEKENRVLKNKTRCSSTYLKEEPIKIATCEPTNRKICRGDGKMLTKTTIEEFNVKPKIRPLGPCTCSVDVNFSDTIRSIFEQVDVEHRKMAEFTYMKYIANKIINGNIETLDAQELSFLHLKVCRVWKSKLTKEEALQKRIDSLENELMNKQRHAQQHIAELDRKVAEERRRLQEVRETVCRSSSPTNSRGSPETEDVLVPPPPPNTAAEKDFILTCHCGYDSTACNHTVAKRRSAGDIAPALPNVGGRVRRPRTETSRAVLAKLDVEQRREKKLYDEPPTRLRKSYERQPLRPHKK